MSRFAGEMWTVSDQAAKRYGLYWIHHSQNPGLSKDPNTINGGGNSGYQAISLAAMFGASRIVLLGYDMQMTDGKHHWHGKHEGGLPNGTNFVTWMSRMRKLAEDLAAAGIETINCTRKTALRHFPRAKLEDTL